MLPKIHSFKTLAMLVAGLILTGLALISLVQVGYNKMIFGENIANNVIYPILGQIISYIALLAIFIIVGVGLYYIVSYLNNRNKPKELSDEMKVINETNRLLQELIKRIDERWPK